MGTRSEFKWSWQERIAELEAERDKANSAREYTQKWYSTHYGKLQDWARKNLPEPWVDEFFSCIANGTHHYSSSDYFRVDTAHCQMILDQTRRAEDAEAERDQLAAQLELARTSLQFVVDEISVDAPCNRYLREQTKRNLAQLAPKPEGEK